MSSHSIWPAENDVLELQNLIKSKKKDSLIIPLMEKMFTYVVDTDKWLCLIELLPLENKKLARYAFYFLSARHGIPQTPLSPASSKLLKELASQEAKSNSPHKSVYYLRMIGSCSRIDEKDSLLMKTISDFLNHWVLGEADSPSGSPRSMKKRRSTKVLSGPQARPLVASECMFSLLTKFHHYDAHFLQHTVLPSVLIGINARDSLLSSHSTSVLLRIVHDPNCDTRHVFSLLSRHLGLDSVVLPSKPIESSKSSSTSSLPTTDLLDISAINKNSVPSRMKWVKVCSRLAKDLVLIELNGILGQSPASEANQRNAIPMTPSGRILGHVSQNSSPSAIQDDIDRLLTEVSDFLFDESERVIFAAMEGLIDIGWQKLSKLYVRNPLVKEGSRESLDLSGSASFKDNNSTSQQASNGGASQHNPSQSLSTSSQLSNSGLVPVLSVIKTRLMTLLASSCTPVAHYATRIAKQLAECYMRYFESGYVPTRDTVSPRKSSSRMSAKPAGLGGRGRTQTRADISVNMGLEEEHPLKDIKGALHIVFKNHKSPCVKTQALAALIWLEFSWNGPELEDLIISAPLGITNTATASLFDTFFEIFLKRVELSPQLVPSILRVYHQFYVRNPSKINSNSLIKAWTSIINIQPLEDNRRKVLDSIFAILDTPHKKDTRTITFNIHKSIYWFLGENAVHITGEKCAELPGQSSIINDVPHFPINNQFIKPIVSRLELAVTSSPWETRVVCLESLAKIAFMASYPLRLRIYDFFRIIGKTDGSSLFPIVAPIVHLLDRIFELRSMWASNYLYGQRLNTQSTIQLISQIQQLKKDMLPYIDLGNLNPIGSDVQKVLDTFNTSLNAETVSIPSPGHSSQDDLESESSSLKGFSFSKEVTKTLDSKSQKLKLKKEKTLKNETSDKDDKSSSEKEKSKTKKKKESSKSPPAEESPSSVKKPTSSKLKQDKASKTS